MNSNEEAGSQRGARLDVRFAVVMYGGVSLAIYINGITQELLRLVRATALREEGGGNSAPAIANEDLRGTERVYRRLGRMISQNAETRRSEDVADDDPITTRFVVDVLAGTSAGGLNAIFLAKALANCQSLDELAHLWLEEGEIAKLINDKDSLDGLSGAKQQTPPRSLLNSNRMFRKLLAALDGMDASGRQCVESDGRTDGSERTRAGSGLTNAHAPSGNGAKRGADDLAATPSPLVEELDLFVTTTDLRGLRVDLRLADQIVQERRHRNVFHFEYRGGTRAQTVNDFVPSNNRFLAFAARCTSAFPVAFEPMTVDAAGLARPQAPATDADDSGWFKFFADYRRDLTDEKLESDLRDRSFADGGYLDNKPFGHAIEALRYRRGSIPVDRKLIYIEPSPDDLEASREPRNAIENGLSAFTLARYETIREDLQRVLARNRLIERVERIFSGLEMDLLRRAHDPEPLDREDYMGAGLRDMIGRQGIAYGGYHRLKVAKLTDEIANAIAVAAAFDPDSDQLLAIRNLVRVWRDENYAEDLPKNRDANTTERADGAPAREAPTMESVKTQNAFLVEYDLGFRLRRIAFVLDRLARIACRDDNAIDILRNGLKDSPTAAPDLRDVLDAPPAIELVAALSRRFSEIHAGLLRLREHLEARSDLHPLTALVLSTQLQTKDLLDTLRPRTDAGRLKEARRIYRRDRGKFDEIAHELGRIIGNGIPAGAASSAFAGERVIGTREAADLVREALDGRVSGPAETVRTAVAYYYEAYDDYDLISFPILHATDAGEEMDMVDVVRFSPRDAPSLIDETSPAESRRKLAGTTLGNFGAFLDRGWRMNDILWGRLDGAERLIAMFVTDEDDRKRLTKEAHESILEEYVAEQCEPELCQTIADAFVAVKSNDRTENALRTALLDQAGAPVNHRLRAALERLLEKEKLRDFYETAYEVNRSLNPRRIV